MLPKEMTSTPSRRTPAAADDDAFHVRQSIYFTRLSLISALPVSSDRGLSASHAIRTSRLSFSRWPHMIIACFLRQLGRPRHLPRRRVSRELA